MASGLVKRAVERGDIFLVVEQTVYVANISWNSVYQEVSGTVSSLILCVSSYLWRGHLRHVGEVESPW